MRLALVGLLWCAPAFAQPIAGTGDDPLRELMLQPAIVDTELPIGLAIRGGNPEDTVLLFDGFELPWAFHDDGVRSIAPRAALETIELRASGFGVEYGRGSSVVSLTSRHERRAAAGELTVLDATAHAASRFGTATLRFAWPRLVEPFRTLEDPGYQDAVARIEVRASRRWALSLSEIGSFFHARPVARIVTTAQYRSPTWTATIAASPLSYATDELEQLGIDTRAELVRTAPRAAGLTKLEWRIGQQTNSSHYTFPTAKTWRHDIGVWSSVGAHLSRDLRATAGLRVDDFNGDVATQPRADLHARVRRDLTLALAAGAYRRPPNQPHEVLTPSLNPERATHVVAGGVFQRGGLWLQGSTYYIDRTRLVIAGELGELSNSGRGTALGVELGATLHRGAWFAGVTTSLASSKRFDFLRARERPADYEQPVRCNVFGSWLRGRWTLGARLQLASGLPYTPITGAIYHSDIDSYEPFYGRSFSARAPFHHQIDLRVDYRVRWSRVMVEAFLDLHNAYANRDALAFRYSYDYRQRIDVTALPLFPFAGLRASL